MKTCHCKSNSHEARNPDFTPLFRYLQTLPMLLRSFLFTAIVLASSAAWSAPKEKFVHQPLPNHTMYQSRGLQGGMALGGIAKNSCQSLVVWEGSAGFSYTPHWYGGGSFRFLGGSPDSSTTISLARYYVNARFSENIGKDFRFFISPVFGFANTDLRKLRREIGGWGSEDSLANLNTFCEERYSTSGISVAYEIGSSYHLYKGLSILLGHQLELTSAAWLTTTLNTGLAVDIYRYSEFMRRRSNSVYVFMELNFMHIVHGSRGTSWDRMFTLGFALGL